MNPERHYCVQVFLVTGGRAGWMTVDSTELFDSSVGSWVVAGAKMPIRLVYLRAINIDDRRIFIINHLGQLKQQGKLRKFLLAQNF